MLFDQARYIRCIFELLNASSHAVKYEAATTLTTLNPKSRSSKRYDLTFPSTLTVSSNPVSSSGGVLLH